MKEKAYKSPSKQNKNKKKEMKKGREKLRK